MLKLYDYEPDASYLLRIVKALDKDEPGGEMRYGVIVDFSNAHGLCFGVIFPNIKGSSSRETKLLIHWFEPEEVEFIS